MSRHTRRLKRKIAGIRQAGPRFFFFSSTAPASEGGVANESSLLRVLSVGFREGGGPRECACAGRGAGLGLRGRRALVAASPRPLHRPWAVLTSWVGSAEVAGQRPRRGALGELPTRDLQPFSTPPGMVTQARLNNMRPRPGAGWGAALPSLPCKSSEGDQTRLKFVFLSRFMNHIFFFF